MSADRDTLARAHGIPAEQIKCANCARYIEFINDMFWCEGWNAPAIADEFCSFFDRKSEGEDDK